MITAKQKKHTASEDCAYIIAGAPVKWNANSYFAEVLSNIYDTPSGTAISRKKVVCEMKNFCSKDSLIQSPV